MRVIDVRGLKKDYKVPVRRPGLREGVKALFRREIRTVPAVRGVDFSVENGEIVGFLGPNGAGKTTTLKMLSGLLHPSGGEVRVLGYVPARRDSDFLRAITLVMGQRSQLQWDIPVADSFECYRAIYDIDRGTYAKRVDELLDLLDLRDLMTKPVRNLSLGERMKCELSAALLHAPQVLFLDEPTLGLDVTMQRRIRAFLRDYNLRNGATILLTSHYMADVEALCDRVVVIHRGAILFDGKRADLTEGFSSHKTLKVELGARHGPAEALDLSEFGEVVGRAGSRATLRIPRGDVARATGALLAQLSVVDLTIEEPSIEDVIDRVFQDGSS